MDKTTEHGPEPLAVDVMGAAKMLGLSRSTILNMADRGELTRIRLGRSVRYSTSEISNLVEQRRRSAAQGAAEAAGLFRLSPPGPAA